MDQELHTKKCRVCGADKPLNHFPKCNKYTDGYDTRCKTCTNAYQKEHRLAKGGGNAELGKYTPRELIEELKARGYKGHLEYTKTIIL